MSDIRKLLEKWAALETDKCKRETRPNKDWHEEFEDYKVLVPPEGYFLVYSDVFPNPYTPSSTQALMRIQWAVQQAIVEKGWYFHILYNKELYQVEMGPEQPSPQFMRGRNLVETLLRSYLKVLDA